MVFKKPFRTRAIKNQSISYFYYLIKNKNYVWRYDGYDGYDGKA